MHPPPWLRVAQIVRPQGRGGEVLDELLTDLPERFSESPRVWLRAGENAPVREAAVESWRLHGGRLVLKLAGVDSIEDAEALRGDEAVVPWAERRALAEDEVYAAELAGCALVDALTSAAVGTITDVEQNLGAGTLLVVERFGGGELLVPFVKAYAPRWDLEARVLMMELPDGLLDLDTKDTDKKQSGSKSHAL